MRAVDYLRQKRESDSAEESTERVLPLTDEEYKSCKGHGEDKPISFLVTGRFKEGSGGHYSLVVDSVEKHEKSKEPYSEKIPTVRLATELRPG